MKILAAVMCITFLVQPQDVEGKCNIQWDDDDDDDDDDDGEAGTCLLVLLLQLINVDDHCFGAQVSRTVN